MKSVSGVYKIYCEGNKKVYIGSSINVRKRKNEHLCYLRKGKHPNKHMQYAFNKYGEEDFSFSLVLQCESEFLLIREEEQIQLHNSYNKGFNLIETPTKSLLGYKHNEASKDKMSKSAKGRIPKNRKFKELEIIQIRQEYFDGARKKDLAKKFKINANTLRRLLFLETYAEIAVDKEYLMMIENEKKEYKIGNRIRTRGWKQSEEFKERFKQAVSKPKMYARKLTDKEVCEIRKRKNMGDTCKILAEEFSVNQNTISRIARGLIYKDIVC